MTMIILFDDNTKKVSIYACSRPNNLGIFKIIYYINKWM